MRPNTVHATLATAVLALAASSLPAQGAGVDVAFLYRLSNFSGVVPYSAVPITADRAHDEVSVAEGDVVRVYNAAGMEIYEFEHDVTNGSILDLVSEESGDILILSYRQGVVPGESGSVVTRCNYRGTPRASFAITGLPEAFSRFVPNVMRYRGGKLYFASTAQMQAVVTDRNGAFGRGWDLQAPMGSDDKEGEIHKDDSNLELGGFDVDAAGNLLFTIPVLFRAFVMTPEGKVESFGKQGAAPGTFGIIAGIAADDQGGLLVADRLRSVVLVFDRTLRFVREFGYRTHKADGLVGPGAIAIGNGGKLYVTQLGSQGVSVFSVTPQ